jgi:hypothetical protein
MNPSSEVAGGFVGILTTNYTDFHGFNLKSDIQFQNQRSLPQRHREHRGLRKMPLPQNLWVKTGIIALRSGARFLEVVHNRPIREWV